MKKFRVYYSYRYPKKNKEGQFEILAEDVKHARSIAYRKALLQLETMQDLRCVDVYDVVPLEDIRPARTDRYGYTFGQADGEPDDFFGDADIANEGDDANEATGTRIPETAQPTNGVFGTSTATPSRYSTGFEYGANEGYYTSSGYVTYNAGTTIVQDSRLGGVQPTPEPTPKKKKTAKGKLTAKKATPSNSIFAQDPRPTERQDETFGEISSRPKVTDSDAAGFHAREETKAEYLKRKADESKTQVHEKFMNEDFHDYMPPVTPKEPKDWTVQEANAHKVKKEQEPAPAEKGKETKWDNFVKAVYSTQDKAKELLGLEKKKKTPQEKKEEAKQVLYGSFHKENKSTGNTLEDSRTERVEQPTVVRPPVDPRIVESLTAYMGERLATQCIANRTYYNYVQEIPRTAAAQMNKQEEFAALDLLDEHVDTALVRDTHNIRFTSMTLGGAFPTLRTGEQILAQRHTNNRVYFAIRKPVNEIVHPAANLRHWILPKGMQPILMPHMQIVHQEEQGNFTHYHVNVTPTTPTPEPTKKGSIKDAGMKKNSPAKKATITSTPKGMNKYKYGGPASGINNSNLNNITEVFPNATPDKINEIAKQQEEHLLKAINELHQPDAIEQISKQIDHQDSSKSLNERIKEDASSYNSKFATDIFPVTPQQYEDLAKQQDEYLRQMYKDRQNYKKEQEAPVTPVWISERDKEILKECFEIAKQEKETEQQLIQEFNDQMNNVVNMSGIPNEYLDGSQTTGNYDDMFNIETNKEETPKEIKTTRPTLNDPSKEKPKFVKFTGTVREIDMNNFPLKQQPKAKKALEDDNTKETKKGAIKKTSHYTNSFKKKDDMSNEGRWEPIYDKKKDLSDNPAYGNYPEDEWDYFYNTKKEKQNPQDLQEDVNKSLKEIKDDLLAKIALLEQELDYYKKKEQDSNKEDLNIKPLDSNCWTHSLKNHEKLKELIKPYREPIKYDSPKSVNAKKKVFKKKLSDTTTSFHPNVEDQSMDKNDQDNNLFNDQGQDKTKG